MMLVVITNDLDFNYDFQKYIIHVFSGEMVNQNLLVLGGYS